MTLIQQQRLLGTVLLLCVIGGIAYFFLSKVDDKPATDMVEQEISFDSVVEPIDDNIDALPYEPEALVDPHQLAETTPAEQNLPVTNKQPDTAPAPAPAPAPKQPVQNQAEQEQWLLQVGSFSVKDNALSLTQQIKKLGYPAYMESVSAGQKTIYRVRLKPSFDKAALEKAAKDLSAKLKLSTQIQQYRD